MPRAWKTHRALIFLTTILVVGLCNSAASSPTPVDDLHGLEVPTRMRIEDEGYPGFRSISVGASHACGIRDSDRTVLCWGNNTLEQSRAPTGVKFQSLSVGNRFTCGIRAVDARVQCWGSNEFGQLKAPGGRFREVSAGGGHVCGLRSNGALRCWGDTGFYQRHEVPEDVRFKSVSAGERHTCGIRQKDHMVQCWQDGLYPGADPPKDVSFSRIKAGTQSTCGVRKDNGKLECWGQLVVPRRPKREEDAYFKRPLDEPVVQLSGSCGLTKSGTLTCWQQSRALQEVNLKFEKFHRNCGITKHERKLVCRSDTIWMEPSGAEFSEVAVGGWRYGVCGIRANDGKVICFQKKQESEYGIKYRGLVVGDSHACAIRESDGRVDCWGTDGYGESTPPESTSFQQLTADGRKTCGIRTSDSRAECWGEWMADPPKLGFTQISLAGLYACGIRSDNQRLACWGGARPHLTFLPKGRYTSVDVGQYTACALRIDGVEVCWGFEARNLVDTKKRTVPLCSGWGGCR